MDPFRNGNLQLTRDAMKPPICRLCRQAHWAHQPHIFPGARPVAELEREEAARPGQKAALVAIVRDKTERIMGRGPPRSKTVSIADALNPSNSRHDGEDDTPPAGVKAPADMTDDELRPYAKEYERRRKAAQRSKQPQLKLARLLRVSFRPDRGPEGNN